MKRGLNGAPWLGFGLAVAAALSYIPIFTRFPATRDFPWVNLLLFLAAGICLAIGARRAYGRPERYRGRLSSVVLGVLSLALCGIFLKGIFIDARNIPAAPDAVRVGELAPDFQLTDTAGKPVSLASLREGKKDVLLIFYRGYW